MTNKLVIFETKWAARDTNKEYPHGWGFMPPFVIFPQDMDVVACAEKCKIVLSKYYTLYHIPDTVRYL